MTQIDAADIEADLSLFRYTGLDPLPAEYRDLDAADRSNRIAAALDELGDDVVVLGHNYQRQEIIEHADFIGDSYQLSKAAADTDASSVVFGGVTFMAETADMITDDDQSVLLPSMAASCPMAGMAETPQVKHAWEAFTQTIDPADLVPITYMNSYASLKAFTGAHDGIVCTSSNADAAFQWAFDHGETILFLPDKHLAINTAHRLGLADEVVVWDPWNPEGTDPAEAADASVIAWDGYCQVHDRFTREHVADLRERRPEANVVVHPECRHEVVEAADVVGSTATIRETVAEADPGETWAIGTEMHLAHHLDRWHADVDVIPLCGEECMDCNAMRQIDPNYLAWVLEELAEGREHNVIDVPADERTAAMTAIDRMLDLDT